MQGVKAIRRVSLCNRCVAEAVDIKNKSMLNATILSLPLQDETLRREISGKVVTDDSVDVVGLSSAFDILQEEELNLSGVNITFEENGEVINHYEYFNTGEDEVNFSAYGLNAEELELILEHRKLGQGQLVAFELEEASKLLRNNRPLLCPFHFTVDPRDVFPDLVSLLYIPRLYFTFNGILQNTVIFFLISYLFDSVFFCFCFFNFQHSISKQCNVLLFQFRKNNIRTFYHCCL